MRTCGGILILAFHLLSSSVLAADMKALAQYDFYASPFFGISKGTYEAGTVDAGDTASAHYGAKLGFKVNSILFGGEFAMLNPWLRSTRENVSAADGIRYNLNNAKTLGALGFNVGAMSDRIVFWANYYPLTSLDTESYQGLTKFENRYRGTSFSVELNFRVWDRLYLGFFGVQQDFTEYSTNHSSGIVKDQELTPNLSMRSYGMTIGYLFPIGELSKMGSWFPTP